MSNWNTLNPFPNGVAKVIAGSNVSVSGTTAYPIITNTGVASLTAGSNITLSGSTGNITIAASGGGNPPVFVDNFNGTLYSYYPSVKTTYSFYTQPLGYSTTFYLPRLNTLSNADWIEIIPVHSTSSSNGGTGIFINYNGSNSIGFPASSTNTAQRLYLVFRDGAWIYTWNGSSGSLQSG
jgi:hypothetical protein